MSNIIGYKDLSNLYIKPAAEPTRTISDIDLKSASEPERVLNPIVSESYMRQYIEEHGGITPTGNIEITENGENINVAPYETATVNVSGSGGLDLLHTDLTITNESAEDVSLLNIPLTVYGYSILLSDIVTQAPNLLKTSVDDNTDLAIELNLLGLTIPANGSISIPLYYITKNTTAPDCYINTTLTGSNLVNMASGEENYFDVTDATENSSITLTIAK